MNCCGGEFKVSGVKTLAAGAVDVGDEVSKRRGTGQVWVGIFGGGSGSVTRFMNFLYHSTTACVEPAHLSPFSL